MFYFVGPLTFSAEFSLLSRNLNSIQGRLSFAAYSLRSTEVKKFEKY